MGVTQSSSDTFRAVADPTRRGILERLRLGESGAGELGDDYNISAATLSEHLRILLESNLVRVRQEGRRRVYSLNPAPLRPLIDWAERFRDITDPSGHVWRVTQADEGAGGSIRSSGKPRLGNKTKEVDHGDQGRAQQAAARHPASGRPRRARGG